MATPDSVKAKIQALIAKANAKTSNTDTDLTSAVDRLVEGYGQGGDGKPIPMETEEELNALIETVTDDDVGKIYSIMPTTTSEAGINPLYFVLTKENE